MRSVFVCLFLLCPLTCRAENRLFVLQGEEAILEVDIDDEGNAQRVRTYRDRDLPGVFPAQSLEMRDGNILATYDEQKRQTARLLYRRSDGLTKYDGSPGRPPILGAGGWRRPTLNRIFAAAADCTPRPAAVTTATAIVSPGCRRRPGPATGTSSSCTTPLSE